MKNSIALFERRLCFLWLSQRATPDLFYPNWYINSVSSGKYITPHNISQKACKHVVAGPSGFESHGVNLCYIPSPSFFLFESVLVVWHIVKLCASERSLFH